MGEARRRRMAGTYPTRKQLLSRAEAISWACDFLATTEDETVSGVTLFPADGSEPVYLPVEAVRRPTGRNH
jgi:hypothetical protein